MTDQAETLREMNHGAAPERPAAAAKPSTAEHPTVLLGKAAKAVVDAYGMTPHGCVIKVDPDARRGCGRLHVIAYVSWWQRWMIDTLVQRLTDLLIELVPNGWELSVETQHAWARGTEVFERDAKGRE